MLPINIINIKSQQYLLCSILAMIYDEISTYTFVFANFGNIRRGQ